MTAVDRMLDPGAVGGFCPAALDGPDASSSLEAAEAAGDPPPATGLNSLEAFDFRTASILPVSLVDHREAVSAHETVARVYDLFRHHEHEFVAVLDGQRFLGLVSRGHVGFLLGTRFGFSLHSRVPICQYLLPDIVQASPGWSILRLLDAALSRTGEAFYHDVALVDDDERFLGVIAIPTLARIQSRLVSEQITALQGQRETLLGRNRQLFENMIELDRLKGQYEALFRNIPLGVALLDGDGRIETCNERMSMWLRDCGTGNPPAVNLMDRMEGSDRQAFQAMLRLHAEDPSQTSSSVIEVQLRGHAEGARLIRCHVNWIQETGQACVASQDITSQRQLERQMALQEKYALFESLVGGIAHELNNKLSPVMGFTDMLESKLKAMGSQGDLERYCSLIISSAEESVKIIRQLLQLSRPSSSERAKVELGAVMKEVIAIMKFPLRNMDARVDLDLPDHEIHILADAPQIKQVLVNLSLNALDAMERSERKELSISAREEERWSVIRVTDTGHGIRPEHVDRIFDPFFTTKPAERGTGLGLSVCLGIVRQHGGDISVRSQYGHGATFEVRLPMLPAADASREAAAGQVSAGRPDPGPDGRRSGSVPVVVIDDEEHITELLEEALRRRFDWNICCFNRGADALRHLECEGVDLLITDLRMPEVSGFAILDWIQEWRPELVRRTLVMTGDSGSKELDRRLQAYRVPILRKPFRIEQLAQNCLDLLRTAPVSDDCGVVA